MSAKKQRTSDGIDKRAALQVPTSTDTEFMQLADTIRLLLIQGGIGKLREAIFTHHTTQERIREYVYLFETRLNFLWWQESIEAFYTRLPKCNFPELFHKINQNYKCAYSLANSVGNSTILFDGAPRQFKIEGIKGGVEDYLMCTYNPTEEPSLEEKKKEDRSCYAVWDKETIGIRGQIKWGKIPPENATYVSADSFIRDHRFNINSRLLPMSPTPLEKRLREIVTKTNQDMLKIQHLPAPSSSKVVKKGCIVNARLLQPSIVPLMYNHELTSKSAKCLCYVCGRTIDSATQLDHIIPPIVAFILGVIDSPLNYAPTHSECNMKKSDILPEFHMASVATSAFLKKSVWLKNLMAGIAQEENRILLNAMKSLNDAQKTLELSVASNAIGNVKQAKQVILNKLPPLLRSMIGGGTPQPSSTPILNPDHSPSMEPRTPPSRSLKIRALTPPTKSLSSPLRSPRISKSKVSETTSVKLPSLTPSPQASALFFRHAITRMMETSDATSEFHVIGIMLYQIIHDFFVMLTQITQTQTQTIVSNDAEISGGDPSDVGLTEYLRKCSGSEGSKQVVLWDMSDRKSFYKFRMRSMHTHSIKYWAFSNQVNVSEIAYDTFILNRVQAIVQYIVGGREDTSLLIQ